MIAVDIFTDGACSGNPGPGGWGALLRYGDTEKEICGGEDATTNNRMELLAAIRAIEALKRPSTVRLHTDSTYLRDGITRWIGGWKANGWKTAAKKPVKNVDLWQRLDAAAARHDIEWRWVKGHAGTTSAPTRWRATRPRSRRRLGTRARASRRIARRPMRNPFFRGQSWLRMVPASLTSYPPPSSRLSWVTVPSSTIIE